MQRLQISYLRTTGLLENPLHPAGPQGFGGA